MAFGAPTPEPFRKILLASLNTPQREPRQELLRATVPSRPKGGTCFLGRPVDSGSLGRLDWVACVFQHTDVVKVGTPKMACNGFSLRFLSNQTPPGSPQRDTRASAAFLFGGGTASIRAALLTRYFGTLSLGLEKVSGLGQFWPPNGLGAAGQSFTR